MPIEQCSSRIANTLEENERLRAEVERLTENQITPEVIQNVAGLHREIATHHHQYRRWVDAMCKRYDEIDRLRAEVEALKQDAERWLLIRLSNKTRVQVVRDGAWHTLFYGGHGNAEDAIDALRGEGE